MDKHMPYFNFLDALKEEGCSICFLLKKTVHKLMDDFLYEQVNDPGVRDAIRESLGFCNMHAWQLQKFGDGFSSSIIYEDLMGLAAGRIGEMAAGGRSIKDLFSKGPKTNNRYYYKKTESSCPVCRLKWKAEAGCIHTFIESFDDPDFFSSYKDSFGLCLPHLRKVIKNCRKKKMSGALLDMELKKMKELIGMLKEIRRRNDYRFSDEGFGKEGGAWIKAIEKMSGKEGIF